MIQMTAEINLTSLKTVAELKSHLNSIAPDGSDVANSTFSVEESDDGRQILIINWDKKVFQHSNHRN